MGVTKVKHSTVDENLLINVYDLLLEHGDEQNAQKILDLYEKFKNGQFVVSFAGHFSAGKSSMINALLETEILPKSPIPTSANIVKITSGDGVARVFFRHEEPIEYKEPYDLDMIKAYCQDKDTISRIELSTSDAIIPRNCSIFDTPGIDAADDADRLMTESSLHLVDMMFYVMDYNHVQSEVNLQFLKNMQAIKIPYYVIINQIDKHDEKELSFTQFEQNIKQTFEQWDVTPRGIFYSSLIDRSAEHNQFPLIKEKLFSIFNADELSEMIRIDEAVEQVVHNHEQYLQQITGEQLAEWSTHDQFTEEDQQKLTTLVEKIEEIEQRPKQIKEAFHHELNQTLKNAYLMPAQLRDLATSFLESQQNDFKVGFFRAKRKTAAEKKKRLRHFFKSLQQSFETNIQWRLRDKLHGVLKQYAILDQEITEQIQNISIDYREEDLLKQLKRGAQLNGNYVLNYTDDVSADIKQRYRQVAQSIWEHIDHHISEELSEKQYDLQQEKNELKQSLRQQKQHDTLQSMLKKKQSALAHVLNDPPVVLDDRRKHMDQQLKITFQPGHLYEEASELHCDSEKATVQTTDETSLDEMTKQPKYSIETVISMIQRTIKTVESLPGFQSMIEDLKEKESRLNHRTYTIALFGAFSAGKSSFSNALIGNEVLPTSPNPTTAVINRILPPTDDYKHGTVVMHMKDERTLVDDLVEITKDFSPQERDAKKLIQWIEEEKIQQSDELDKTYRSFLQAILNGYESSINHLGKKRFIEMDHFEAYITDETKACYIEAMDLYYDCSLTRQGITLVDTPGADSVNARHTNVAFDYIKYADALIYVTYYNHALSRADRDFVMQLGRVKETFELDKMFFIINASDLAENNQELDLVTNYVEDQLLHLGIRFPRIFPLSSKQSLEDKLTNRPLNEQMEKFERSFTSFIEDDLDSLMIESALFEINRTKQSLKSFIETVHLNEQEKDTFKEKLFREQQHLEEIIKAIDPHLFEERIEHRMKRQLHYVVERLSIRFHDFFKDTFNPTTITESSRKAMPQLRRALKKLFNYSSQELLQEIRAVSLRIENYLRELMEEVDADVRKNIQAINTKFIMPSSIQLDLQTPEYDQAFQHLTEKPFEHVLATYKGTKAFFVNQEREQMKEHIYEILLPFIEEYIAEMAVRMKDVYFKQWEEIVLNRQQQLLKEKSLYVDHHVTMMSEQVDTNELHEKYTVLTTMMNE